MVQMNSQSPTSKVSPSSRSRGTIRPRFFNDGSSRQRSRSSNGTVRSFLLSCCRISRIIRLILLVAGLYICVIVPITYRHMHTSSIKTSHNDNNNDRTKASVRQSHLQGSTTTNLEHDSIHIVFSTGCTSNQDCTCVSSFAFFIMGEQLNL
jgi:hypothetical protein